nr:hypothetical protein [Tanacetum cinerariifolium]
MLMVKDNVGNQFRPNAVQNVRNQVVQNAIQNPAPVEGNGNGINGNLIRCYNCRGLEEEARIQSTQGEFEFMAAADAYEETKKVKASTSGTRSDKAPIYDSDGSVEVYLLENCYDNDIFNMFTQEEQYTELLEPIHKPHQVPQNDSNVISEVSSVEQGEGTIEQHPANIKETRVLYDSLYNNLAIEVEKVNLVNRKLRETNADLTTELARYKDQEKCFEISHEKYDKLK